MNGDLRVVSVKDNSIQLNNKAESGLFGSSGSPSKQTAFTFDHVFDSSSASGKGGSQAEVFETIGKKVCM